MNTQKFFAAVATNNAQDVDKLCAKLPNMNVKNKNGRTALMLASGLGETNVVKILLDHGADVNVLDNVVGVSALHLAAQKGSVAIAKLLLEHGAQINLQVAANGLTPLMNAVWYRNAAMVKFLLAQPNINVDIKSSFDSTAADMINPNAVVEDNTKTMPADKTTQELQKLFAEYAQKEEQYIKAHPLLVLEQQYAKDKNPATLQKIAQLIKHGTDINAKLFIDDSGNAGHTALLMAARDGLDDVVKLLLDAGADMSLTGAYMNATPLHKAAYMGHSDVLKTLATKQPDFNNILNAQGPDNGYTALHDAVWHDNLAATEVLLQQGADTSLKGLDGYTALDLAKKYGYKDIEALMN
ncbi:MAG: ankyrin repeat domain-containing protein [Gammaproteobacteria bacterium]|nr:ankyrin repeat domain-containing protein [Gammaproteobacteria bacterium]